ncbi:hypothetical protein PLICRDRAFT_533106 [Plicaturopsis crispa FD-325 SS-3]|nr:hypothetical protein PLICRDRAFT_533106 [Plicaturopsis crispa FD-325 SS-3]
MSSTPEPAARSTSSTTRVPPGFRTTQLMPVSTKGDVPIMKEMEVRPCTQCKRRPVIVASPWKRCDRCRENGRRAEQRKQAKRKSLAAMIDGIEDDPSATASSDAQSAAPVPEKRADDARPSGRACSICKHAIPLEQAWKTCTRCRERGREQNRRSRQRKRASDAASSEADATMALDSDDAEGGPTLSSMKEALDVAKRKARDSPAGKPPAAKRPKLADYGSSSKSKQPESEWYKGIAPTTYQNVFDFLERVATLVETKKKTARVQFGGTYSIVAMPGIDHARRIERVAADVRDTAKLPYDDRPLGTSHEGKVGTRYKVWTSTYVCKCCCPTGAAPQKSPRPAASASASPYTSLPLGPPQRSVCGGTVHIRVEDDDSHPLKFVGQKISLWVEHSV